MAYASYDTPSEFFGPGYEVASNKIQISTSNNAGVTIGTMTAVAETNVITTPAHNLQVGHVVTLSNSGGALPSPLVPGTRYFVKSVPLGTTLTLSATNGGSEIDLTTTGTGTSTMTCPPVLTNLDSTQAGANTAQVVFGITDAIYQRFNSIETANRPEKFRISRSGSTDEATGELVYNYTITLRVAPTGLVAVNS